MCNIKSKEIAFICAYGRTGSSALHSMLDNHNDILMLPMELKFYYCINKSKNLKTVDKVFNYWVNETKLKRFEKNILYGNATEKFTNINFAQFKNNFFEFLNLYGLTRPGIFYAIHHAYAKSLNRNIEEIKVIIEFSAASFNLSKAKEDFNNFKVLNVVRDFKASFSSQKMNDLKNNFMIYNRNKFYVPNVFTYYNNLLFPLKNLQNMDNVKENLLDIYLEDLHEKIKLVSNFLKIQYNKKLLENTLGGYNWRGNSAFQKEVTVGKYNPLKNINYALNYNEIMLVEYLFHKYYYKYYKKKITTKLNFGYYLNIFKPFKFEFVVPKFKPLYDFSIGTKKGDYDPSALNNYNFSIKNFIKININNLTSFLFYLPLRVLLIFLIFKKKIYS